MRGGAMRSVLACTAVGNPNGIPSPSPGLRGTSYPGKKSRMDYNPKRGCDWNRARKRSRMTPSLSGKRNHPARSSRAWLCGLRGRTMTRQEEHHRPMRAQDERQARLHRPNPKWDERSVRDQPQPRWGCSAFPSSTQGSRLAATLGFATESLWDSCAEYVQTRVFGEGADHRTRGRVRSPTHLPFDL